MEVRIGETVIADAKAERFISLESGLPTLMIRVNYSGVPIDAVNRAFVEHESILFECDFHPLSEVEVEAAIQRAR